MVKRKQNEFDESGRKQKGFDGSGRKQNEFDESGRKQKGFDASRDFQNFWRCKISGSLIPFLFFFFFFLLQSNHFTEASKSSETSVSNQQVPLEIIVNGLQTKNFNPHEEEHERLLRRAVSATELKQMREAVKAEFYHAWIGYKTFSGFEHDELKPVSNGPYDWMKLHLTCISALDTLFLMGFHSEFDEARTFLKTSFHVEKDLNVSVFETTIRVLGGLLGAYELSNDHLLLLKAKQLADKLLNAFYISPSGIPYPSVNLLTGKGYKTWSQEVTTLAEIGSLQLEFNSLSYHLKDNIYRNKARQIISQLDEINPLGGIYPLLYNLSTGEISGALGYTFTVGGLADSFYEYLLKQWFQSGKLDDKLKQLYDEAVDGLVRYLLRKSTPSGQIYVETYQGNKLTESMDHLTCFLPGLLALGSDPTDPNSVGLKVARELLKTCVDMYFCSASGLAPESVKFSPNQDFMALNPKYLLRPETIESLFVLYRVVKDVRYIHYGWRIFQSIVEHCKTPSGFSGLVDVGFISNPPKDDLMQAYFLSETLKYLYLLFSEEEILPLDKVLSLKKKMNPADIAKQFTGHYYTLFDQKDSRSQLINLYQDQSMLTFETDQIQGRNNIIAKLMTYPNVRHVPTTIDVQPTVQNSLLIFVSGNLYIDQDQNPVKFSQVFILVPNGNTFFVLNDMFRLNYA